MRLGEGVFACLHHDRLVIRVRAVQGGQEAGTLPTGQGRLRQPGWCPARGQAVSKHLNACSIDSIFVRN